MPSSLDSNDADLIRRIQTSLRALPDVPTWATARAMAVWRTPAPAQPHLLQRLVAVLRFDSAETHAGLALRARDAAPRQLLYSVGGHDIDLRLTSVAANPDRHDLCGQVLGPATAGRAAWLPMSTDDDNADGSVPCAEANVDEMGEFVLSNLPSGRGRLRLRLDIDTVELPPIDLGPSTEQD